MKILNYEPKTDNEATGWLIEEMGELAQALGKNMRYPGGSWPPSSDHPEGVTNIQKIKDELYDLEKAIAAYKRFLYKDEPYQAAVARLVRE